MGDLAFTAIKALLDYLTSVASGTLALLSLLICRFAGFAISSSNMALSMVLDRGCTLFAGFTINSSNIVLSMPTDRGCSATVLAANCSPGLGRIHVPATVVLVR